MGTVVEKIQYIEGTKQAIKKAIKGKGVEVSDTDTFRSYAEKIKEIGSGGGGSSVAEYVYEDKTEIVAFPRKLSTESTDYMFTDETSYKASDLEFSCYEPSSSIEGMSNFFDGNLATSGNLINGFFFKFDKPVLLKKLYVYNSGGYEITLRGTNNPEIATTSYSDLWETIYTGGAEGYDVDLETTQEYQYYCLSKSSGYKTIYELKFYAVVGSIRCTLKSANMTPSFKCFFDDYMQVITQDWHNGSEVIPSQTLTFKPYEDGGCLVNYNDDGKATNLKMYLLNSTGEEVITEVPFVQPVLTENGTMGGDSFAVDDDFKSSEHPVWHAFDGDNSSYWRDANIPGYINIYNPNPLVIKNIRWGFFYSYPTAGNVQGSNDGSDWELIKEWTNNKESDFDIDLSDNTKAFKYYRINISSVNMDVIHCSNLTITGKEIASVTYDKPIYVLAPDDDFTLEGYREKTQVADLNIPERLP